MERKISDRAIRMMSYKMRLDNYEREKNELFMKLASMPAEEIARAHEALVKKWRL